MKRSLLAPSLAVLSSCFALCGCTSGSPAATASTEGGGATLTVEDAIGRLERGEALGWVCFAISPAADVMCAVGSRSIQDGATLAIRVLGAAPAEFAYYQHPEGQQFLELDMAQLDRSAIARARNHVTAGNFRPLDGPSVLVPPGGDVTVGAHRLRRTRTRTGQDGDPATGEWAVFEDTLALRCGEELRTLTLAGPAFGHSVGEPTITARALPGGALLLTADVSYSLEGDQGSATDAVVIHPATICR